jgi:uncharacterized membrane protein YeaQ/YmgE (transglycosylase-associated protein family)
VSLQRLSETSLIHRPVDLVTSRLAFPASKGVNPLSIIAWIVVGLLAGFIAKALMPGREPGGLLLTIVLGIAGAIVGGFLAVALGVSDGVNNFDIGTIVLAVLGAMLLLVVYRSVTSGKRGF